MSLLAASCHKCPANATFKRGRQLRLYFFTGAQSAQVAHLDSTDWATWAIMVIIKKCGHGR